MTQLSNYMTVSFQRKKLSLKIFNIFYIGLSKSSLSAPHKRGIPELTEVYVHKCGTWSNWTPPRRCVKLWMNLHWTKVHLSQLLLWPIIILIILVNDTSLDSLNFWAHSIICSKLGIWYHIFFENKRVQYL